METDDDRVAFFNDKSDDGVTSWNQKWCTIMHYISTLPIITSYIQIMLSISNTGVYKVKRNKVLILFITLLFLQNIRHQNTHDIIVIIVFNSVQGL